MSVCNNNREFDSRTNETKHNLHVKVYRFNEGKYFLYLESTRFSLCKLLLDEKKRNEMKRIVAAPVKSISKLTAFNNKSED